MYEAHAKDPRANSVEALAVKYRVRQQRILAILTLKKARHARPRTSPCASHPPAPADGAPARGRRPAVGFGACRRC